MAAAPEAEALVAGSGAGGLARGRGRGGKPRPNKRPAATVAPAAQLPAAPAAPADEPAAPAPTPPRAGAAASYWTPGPITVGNAGGGLVLGGLAYVLGLTYLRSGRDGVKALLRAKFLNKVG